MDPPAGVAAEIGFEEPRSDRVAGMRHHRQGQGRQHSPQQGEVILAETLSAVGGKRIADAGSAGGIALRPETDDLGEIVGSAGAGELFENRKIEERLRPRQPSTHIPPRITVSATGFYLTDQIGERASQPNLAILVAALELRGLDRIEIAPPEIAVAAPLRMQRPHRRRGAPQREPAENTPLTEAIEQLGSGSTEQSLPHRPAVQLDDALPERGVKADRPRLGHQLRAAPRAGLLHQLLQHLIRLL